jgi:hypothetical protein
VVIPNRPCLGNSTSGVPPHPRGHLLASHTLWCISLRWAATLGVQSSRIAHSPASIVPPLGLDGSQGKAFVRASPLQPGPTGCSQSALPSPQDESSSQARVHALSRESEHDNDRHTRQ